MSIVYYYMNYDSYISIDLKIEKSIKYNGKQQFPVNSLYCTLFPLDFILL